MSLRWERLRWGAAAAGPLLFFASSLTPLFGGGAKHWARCDGREFTGELDDCFTDYIPMLELITPVIALALSWMFARFAFALWAPEPDCRTMRWRLASSLAAEDHWPVIHGVAAIGAAWAAWRGTTYFFAVELWPYAAFWLCFAAWFAGGLLVAWPRNPGD